MICGHCKKIVHGKAEVYDSLVLHEDCWPAYFAAQRGLKHRCPQCSGSGWEYNRDVHSTESYDPADGYNGWGGPIATRVVTRHEEKRCDFCSGQGFLKKEPKPIMQPAQEAKVIGWRRE